MTNVNLKNAGIPNKIIFGGSGGSFQPINNTENQQIIFKGGVLVDSIQIGNTTYGGKGGSEQGRAMLPADGSFTLTKIQAKLSKLNTASQCINYFEANINGVPVKVGQEDSQATTIDVNIQVTISGINSGIYIDSMQFNIVQ